MEQADAAPAAVIAPWMREYIVRYYGKNGTPELRQHIYFEASRPYVLVDLDAVSNQPLSSRKISPIVLAANGGARFSVKTRPTVLFVPNDNDMWVRYNEPIDPAKDPDSYEVTAIFDNAVARGWCSARSLMIFGERVCWHAIWEKAALGKVEVYGGATGHWTHDVDPHGIVTGTTIHSPLVMVGYFLDWRQGMETYSQINPQIHPPLPWSGGVPFGWNSWSAYLEKTSRNTWQ
jgi:alpha-galactosidase